MKYTGHKKSQSSKNPQIKTYQKRNDKSSGSAHPLILLTEKYAAQLRKYGIDLKKIYALLREQLIHKKEFAKQKALLKKEVFKPIISEITRLSDFSFSLQERIELWYNVFGVLPYTFAEKDPEVIFNVYPRYEYAGIVSIGYVLSGYDDRALKQRIITKSVKGERTTTHMKALFNNVITSPYKDEFIRRTRHFLAETRQIVTSAPKGEKRAARQIEEDFNFGFSWVAFHLPS